MTRIALIHAVQVAMAPVHKAFARHWPQAELINILDETLGLERAQSNELTPAMYQRIFQLAAHAQSHGADAVLFTCSAFGSAIEAANRELRIPVLKPNEGMFLQALEQGRQVGMVGSFAPAMLGMEQEFRELASALEKDAFIRSSCSSEARTALKQGDLAGHNQLMAEQARQLADCDLLMLAHFSSAPAADLVAREMNKPVLTSPDSAVLQLKRLLSA